MPLPDVFPGRRAPGHRGRHGIVPTDPRQRYREKIARVMLDSMVQFIGLLDARGTVLEINNLRQLPGLADLRLIAVTGYGQEADRRRTREAGFHGHLVKPVDIDAIEATLEPASSRSSSPAPPSVC